MKEYKKEVKITKEGRLSIKRFHGVWVDQECPEKHKYCGAHCPKFHEYISYGGEFSDIIICDNYLHADKVTDERVNWEKR